MSDCGASAETRRSRTGRFSRALRRPWLVAAGLAAIGFGVGGLISYFNWPVPRVHDEFSYLLAADTFAHGRLTNPPHPEWQHLETFHVIQQPTYASKYPPGQGAALAIGQTLAGEPLEAIWGLSALAAAATYWMLLGWTSPRFSALGAILWLAHPSFQLVWGQTYWGGTLAYIGGALVFGAALRMQRRAAARDAVMMASGAIVLAITRPYEGFVFCALTGVWLVWHWSRHGLPPVRSFLTRIVAPQSVILAIGAGGLGAYNQAVTGSPWTMPYQVHESAYGQSPMFVLGTPAPKPAYRFAEFDDFHSVWELDWYRRQSSLRSWASTKFAVTWLAGEFFLTPIIFAGVLACRPWRWSRVTPAVAVAMLSFAGSLAIVWYNPHYLAPFAPLVILAAVAGLRRIDLLGRRNFESLRLAPLLVACQIVLFAVAVFQYVEHPRRGWFTERDDIVKLLDQSPDRHLILVRYGPGHSCHDEWVFNGADVDGSKIVWARAMDPANDAELLHYFHDRRAWLLEPEARRLAPIDREGKVLAATAAGARP